MINEYELEEYIKSKKYRLINSVLVWQDGEILIEKYFNGFNKDSRNVIRSVVKSILSIAAGICLDRGLIKSLNDPICRYLEEFNQQIHPYHRAITIRNLLTMTSGIYWVGGVHYHCPQLSLIRKSKNWIEFIADNDVVSVPGTKFNYSEYDVILLTAVIQKVTGEDIFDYINENIYKPLNIKSGPWWKSSCNIGYSCAEGGEGNDGINESPSNLTAREMLNIGRLLLQKGIYNDSRIISEQYIKDVISPSKQNYRYGYLWWLGEDYYGCRGFGGQNITVIPSKDVIIVVQATPTARGKEYDDVVMTIKGTL